MGDADGLGAVVGLAALLFNLSALPSAISCRAPPASKRQATAIGMEIGIHNGTLAIAIALARCF